MGMQICIPFHDAKEMCYKRYIWFEALKSFVQSALLMAFNICNVMIATTLETGMI